MSISKDLFSKYIKGFQFRELFNEMGWNNDATKQNLNVDNKIYKLNGIAEKSGFRILICATEDNKSIPDYNTRKKIEGKITKLFQEHLIIYHDDNKKEQIWQLAVRKSGSPVKITETRYSVTQNPELLYQRTRGLFFSLDEEDKITIVDVTKRVAENFNQNNERVTKRFYENFKKQHTAFLGFIKGIDDKLNHEWYASLMLNRLMFCYFIQKKGFLDNNRDYLRDKLNACREKKGKNKFYSFYRDFLLVLFHEGLGSPEHDKFEIEIGKIPYLNGGLFDEHEIEKMYKDIKIDDEAFIKIFDFFDQYEWHLDTRADANGMEINPDVIGYIFEKYINDRAQMGAYYTKEDITDYIAKNCIIPYLFDEVGRNYKQLFIKNQIIWKMIKESGDRYIYDAVKYGIPEKGDIYGDLPDEILKGFNPELASKVVDGTEPYLFELRKNWNKQALQEVALPTEIYREVIERRKRYKELKDLISSGKIESINDFITYNLNIRQFVQDVLETIDDPEFIKEFYKALSSITILDPTCGSGAFLFAAMNILEPLYEACIQRMENYVLEGGKGKYKFFEKELEIIKSPQHPNLAYFIYKSIILNNLYGVDIMKEAVEIAKLRLFLKLVATVDVDHRKPNMGLEPLPDVDFNIRSGNTLVGYATKHEIDSIAGLLVTNEHKKKILEQCDVVSCAFIRYKDIQLSNGEEHQSFKKAKDNLVERLKNLTDDLDGILYMERYGGVNLNDKDFNNWLSTHQAFHWFAEFYGIINYQGGFKVIIGNPPYVEYSKVKKEYTVKYFETESCGNLYPLVVEKSHDIINKFGIIGFIIPLSAFCTQRMKPLVQLYKAPNHNCWISHFGWRPATLFEGVNIPLSIAIKNLSSNENKIYVTEFNKWYQEKRDFITSLLSYNEITKLLYHDFVIPKIGFEFNTILNKVTSIKNTIGKYLRNTNHSIYYRNTGGLYWRIILDFEPQFFLNGDASTSSTLAKLSFETPEQVKIFTSFLNSNLFWLYYVAYSSFHHVNPVDIISFFVSYDEIDHNLKISLKKLGEELMSDMIKNSTMQTRIHKGGNNSQSQTFYPSLSKVIVDKIDINIAQYYKFTHEELDRIINYDITFRLQMEDSDD